MSWDKGNGSSAGLGLVPAHPAGIAGARKAELGGKEPEWGMLSPLRARCPAGYHTYCHYLKVEVSQGHPLLKAFCCLLLQPGRTEPHPQPRETHLEEGGTWEHRGDQGRDSLVRSWENLWLV